MQNSNSKSSSIAKSIDAYLKAPARNPATYRIIEWNMSEHHLRGSVMLTGSRSFKNLEVSQTITFEGLRLEVCSIDTITHIAINQKAVTLESTDSNTFSLIVDGNAFFKGKAIEARTGNRSFGLEGPDTYASFNVKASS